MMKKLFYLTPLCLLCVANAKDSTCSDGDYVIAGKFLGIAAFWHQVIVGDCKVWPYDKRYKIVAFGYDPMRYASPEKSDKEILFGLLDMEIKTIISSTKWAVYDGVEGGLDEYSLKIDTARYQLNEGTRAIGLEYRPANKGANCPDHAREGELTLYVKEEKNLRSVFTMFRKQFRSLKGCMGMPKEDDKIEAVDLTLSIGAQTNNHFNDIVVVAKLEGSNKIYGRQTLSYDGKQYKISPKAPWWLK